MNINTPVGRLGLESLFATSEYEGKELNSVELIFNDVSVLANFKAQIIDHVTKELKGNIPGNFRWPWKKNETRVYSKTGERCNGYADGGEWLRIKRTASEPRIGPLDPLMIRNGAEPAKPRDIYPGCFGRAHCYINIYPNKGSGPGVSLCLEGFQKTGDGERFGAAPASANVFDDGVVPADELSI